MPTSRPATSGEHLGINGGFLTKLFSCQFSALHDRRLIEFFLDIHKVDIFVIPNVNKMEIVTAQLYSYTNLKIFRHYIPNRGCAEKHSADRQGANFRERTSI